jgi:hypothetical protein
VNGYVSSLFQVLESASTDQMSRVLLFIENDMYVRNFITSGAFDALLEREDCGLCPSSFVQKLKSALRSDRVVGFYDRHPDNAKIVYSYNKLSMRARRRQSSTFDIKIRSGWPYGGYSLKERIGSHPVIFERLTKDRLISGFRPNPSLEKIIRAQRPELVIFPFTGVESTGYELILLGREYGFRTFFLVNGWDNLSSKGVLVLPPDYLGAWGPQSMIDAVAIHGMRPHRVILMGCARYEDYFKGDACAQSPFPFKYVLFAGSTTPNDEISPLQLFDEVLEEMGSHLKIVYRPHPWREKRNCFDHFDPGSYKHTLIDPQVADAYFGEKTNGTESSSSLNFPTLKYYPSLVSHAVFAISPMSSMTLEAALYDVPSLVLAHDDGYHSIPGSLQAQYRHFEGGDEVPGWYYVRHLSDLKPTFRALVERFRDDAPGCRTLAPILSQAMTKYLFRDERSYALRLLHAVQMILVNNDSAIPGVSDDAHEKRSNRTPL